MCTGGHSLVALSRQTSERTAEGASTECMSRRSIEKSAKINLRCRRVHRRSTILPHLFHRHGFWTFACRIFRHSPGVAAVLLWASASAAQPPAPSVDVPSRPAVRQELTSTVLYRVFLQGGTALVSYGEFARVGDRVVLSIPIGELSDTPTLQLVSIPQSSVDWERTERYAAAVRARRYGETRGEADFALLGARVVEALNLISSTEIRRGGSRWRRKHVTTLRAGRRTIRLPGPRRRAADGHARRRDFRAEGCGWRDASCEPGGEHRSSRRADARHRRISANPWNRR